MTEIGIGVLLLVALILALTLAVLLARAILTPSRPAMVSVNGSTRIDTRTGSKLLWILQSAGILIPSACAGAGTCGLCKVRITDGNVEALPTEVARLSKAELRAGTHLACQLTLRSDMSVEVDPAYLDARSFVCRVTSVRHLTPLIREIVLQLSDGQRPEIAAGAFVQLTAPPFGLDYADIQVPPEHCAAWQPLRHLSVASDQRVTRAYSVSNRPEDAVANRIVLNIRLALPPPAVPEAPPGIVSSWLFSVKEGDTIETSGPFGSFGARGSDREMVLIGGGVGMAPLRAIVFDQLERIGTNRNITFWYGARSRAELFYVDEFEDLARRHPNFTWTAALSDPAPGDWDGPTGFVHQVAHDWYLRDHPAPDECEYYLCGPPLMIRAVFAMLDDLGVERHSILFDDFGV